MAFGLTDAGFIIKRVDDIKTEVEASLRTALGNTINLLATELLGQIVGIFTEREALIWEIAQDVYDSQSPPSANGNSLDSVVALTGIQRLDATKSTVSGVAYGTEGTIITQNSIVSVDGDPEARFLMDSDFTIGPGTDEIQLITFSTVPDAGAFTLVFDGDETGDINYSDAAVDVQAQLNGLTSLSGVTVTGDFTAGFEITFSGSDGQQNQPLLTTGSNSLETTSVAVNITIAEDTTGVLPNVTCTLTAETAGSTQAYATTLTVIETVISGWDSFSNPLDAVAGRDTETDAELRIRREQTLAAPGTSTVEAIRSKILQIDEVEDAIVYANYENVVDGDGRPPHSLECVVLNGDDQDIWNTIFGCAPAGIYQVGTEVGTVVDSQGFNQTIRFNRPTEIDIYLEIDITTDATFPSGGDNTLKTQILSYVEDNFSIGDDVVVFGTISIASAIGETGGVAGITDYVIRIGTTASPTLDDNVVISASEIAVFDTSRITITIL